MYRVIIEHHPKKGQEKALIKQWQKGSDVIQTYPGARGTKLFRDPNKPEILYAMADWETAEFREEAFENIKKEHADSEQIFHGYEAYLDSHETIGRFDLIAESNPPVKK